MESIAGLTLWDRLENADRVATMSINSLHCSFTDAMWRVFSDKEIWYPLYLAVLIFLFIRLGWKKALIVTVSCILTIVACDQFANFTKEFFGRLRPCWDSFTAGRGLHLLEGRGNLHGFYSAHAANAIGFAVCSTIGFSNARKINMPRHEVYKYCILAWAFLVGVSRIFVGKHFLGDVLTGFVVGSLFAWGIASLARFAIRKLNLQQR
mgnify:FL=1